MHLRVFVLAAVYVHCVHPGMPITAGVRPSFGALQDWQVFNFSDSAGVCPKYPSGQLVGHDVSPLSGVCRNQLVHFVQAGLAFPWAGPVHSAQLVTPSEHFLQVLPLSVVSVSSV